MQKNVYRLSNDALNPDKLFVGATVSKNAGKAVTATRRHKNRTLKPLRSTAAMSSSLPAARMQALLHGAVVNEHPFPTDAEPSEHDGHIQSGGRVAKDVVELTPDLSNSAYFKSLFKAVDRKKSKSAPRPLPALPQKIGASAVNTSEKSSYFYEQYLPRAEDTSSKMHSPGEAHALEGNFSTADFQASYTEPLLEELKETIHCMLLPHNMTPRGSGGDGGGGGGRDSAPLTPPPTEHGLPLNPPTRPTTTTAGPVSHFFVMSDDTAPSSPREAPPTTMSVAGKKLLKSICSPTHSHSQISLAEDDMSSMASVGSALTQHSAVSRHRVVGKDIIRAYNDNISKT